MKILVGKVSDKCSLKVPSYFLKNKYSIVEYKLLTEGLNSSEFIVKYTSNGKPYIEKGDINISISHDKDIVVCAFDNKRIGIDISYIRNINNDFKSFINADGLSDLEALKMFSIKESIIKLNGSLLKNINDYNLSDYKINVITTSDYIITIVREK